MTMGIGKYMAVGTGHGQTPGRGRNHEPASGADQARTVVARGRSQPAVLLWRLLRPGIVWQFPKVSGMFRSVRK